MAFIDFWNGKCKANPLLKEPNTVMKITAESFRKELQKAHDHGANIWVDFGKEESKSTWTGWAEPDTNYNRFHSLFSSIFGEGGLFDKIFGGYDYKS